MSSAVDLVDRRILSIIQDDAEQSAETIAPMVNLSASAVQRRLARLKRDRVIEKISAIVDPKKIGLPLTVLVKVQCDSNRHSSQDAFRRWISRESSVQGCWHIAGEFDYFMVIVVRDLDAYNELSQRMMSAALGLHRIESIVAFQTVKRGLAIDLDCRAQDRG